METFFPEPPHQIKDIKAGLLMFYVGNEYLYSILWSHWGAVCITKIMPCEEIAKLVDKFQVAIDPYSVCTVVDKNFKSFIYDWGPRLVPDAGILADYHVLTIIPHRLLHGLPFHAIWIEGNERYLGTTHGISYCSSATLFSLCVDRNIRRLNINISSNVSEAETIPPWLPTACVTVAADVEGVRNKEFNEIANEFSRYFPETNSVFSTRLFKRLVAQSPISPICIVCHGYVDKEKPSASALMLNSIRPGVDGFDAKRFMFSGMQASDISIVQDLAYERPIFINENCNFLFRDLPFRHTLPRYKDEESEAMTIDELCIDVGTNSSLVALFACHSAEGGELIGDDYTSFAYQWLKIGAASVLANCWESDCNVIKEFSSYFMEYWIQDRRPKAIAFSLALRNCIQKYSDKPYKWAVLSLFGDWL
jgi:CHAT domain-containing protein